MLRKLSACSLTGALMASSAVAGGLDRTGQPIGVIFQDGNYLEFSASRTAPDLTGTDLITSADIDNAGNGFNSVGGAIKYDLAPNFSLSVIAEEPFGSDIEYNGSPFTSALGGTSAFADTFSLTAIGRYKFNDNFSVHAGLRQQTIEGNITLSGLAYGGLSGYNVDLGADSAFGYVIGAAYEMPEIALRVAVTYNSAVDHELQTAETVFGTPVAPTSVTEISSPESINVDFQTGIAEGTLLFGNVRYVKWSDLIISPAFFDGAVDPGESGSSISQLDDSTGVTLGIARQLTQNFSGSVALGWESEGADSLVSPLSPVNGQTSIALGGRYDVGNGVNISGGVRYTMLGDALPETGTPDTARADFSDNDAVTVGFRVGVSF
ncbi:MAG: outer membrane protein transport protein [Pseudomonadota bacterium]